MTVIWLKTINYTNNIWELYFILSEKSSFHIYTTDNATDMVSC